MGWFESLFYGHTVAQAVVVLGLVIAAGLAFGSIRVYGIGLGIAGVLFAGLAAAHFGLQLNEEILEFAREFGLILFVYTIGLQVGPGFFSSLRRHGLQLNLLAGGVVLLGAVVTVLISKYGGVIMPAAVGLFSGATTNTPSLAAAQQALREMAGVPAALRDATVVLPGMAYAIAYPFGVLGIILAMLLIRVIFRVDPQAEYEALRRQQAEGGSRVGSMNIKVTNPNLGGLAIRHIPMVEGTGIVISRILNEGVVRVAHPDDKVAIGDVVLAVGPEQKLEQLQLVIGSRSDIDLRNLPGDVISRRLMVTRRSVVGHSVDELGFLEKYGVAVTRVIRSEVELTPTPQLKVQLGDRIVAVGEKTAIDRVAREVGDQIRDLDHPNLLPVFVGIIVGVIVGSIPVSVPGMPAPVKLGLAGGPLLVSIVLSRINRIGPLVWYLPAPANYALRESGIVLFLACVGLKSGGKFVETLTQGDGLYWMAVAAIITFVPIMTIGLIARIFLRMNYLSICGLLSGSMTDPPALSYATTIAGPEAPSVAYATVYPLTMILRVVAAQVMVLVFTK